MIIYDVCSFMFTEKKKQWSSAVKLFRNQFIGKEKCCNVLVTFQTLVILTLMACNIISKYAALLWTVNHMLRPELIWKQKRSIAARMKPMSCQCVGKTKERQGVSHGSHGSQRIDPLRPSLFSVPSTSPSSGMLGKSWLRLKGLRCSLSWQLCIHRLYTNNSQTWTANATSSFSKLFWRHSQKMRLKSTGVWLHAEMFMCSLSIQRRRTQHPTHPVMFTCSDQHAEVEPWTRTDLSVFIVLKYWLRELVSAMGKKNISLFISQFWDVNWQFWLLSSNWLVFSELWEINLQ